MSDIGAALEEVRPWLSTGGILGLLGLCSRLWIVNRKLRITEKGDDREGYGALINKQNEVIERLDARVAELEAKIEDQRERHEQILAFERASHEAELSLQRHATRNAKQILYGILDLIEAAPGKAREHAAKMRLRMRELDALEHAEAATIRGAKIVATAPSVAPAVVEPSPTS